MALVGRFAPPLALMGLIFFLSAQEDLSSGLGSADLILRKLAHMTEYGVLFLLWLRALGRPARPVVAAAITVLYAASDEWHQSFVTGRHGTPVDVLIDAAGVAVAFVLWRARRLSRAASASS
jgi:VanZ family protein